MAASKKTRIDSQEREARELVWKSFEERTRRFEATKEAYVGAAVALKAKIAAEVDLGEQILLLEKEYGQTRQDILERFSSLNVSRAQLNSAVRAWKRANNDDSSDGEEEDVLEVEEEVSEPSKGTAPKTNK